MTVLEWVRTGLTVGTFAIIVFLLVLAIKTRHVTNELIGNMLRITKTQRDEIRALEERVKVLEGKNGQQHQHDQHDQHE